MMWQTIKNKGQHRYKQNLFASNTVEKEVLLGPHIGHP